VRFRKAEGNQPPKVTLTQEEIVDACYEYLRSQGLKLGSTCWLKIPLNTDPKKRKQKLEFISSLEQDETR
jgi:hypothetical protein